MLALALCGCAAAHSGVEVDSILTSYTKDGYVFVRLTDSSRNLTGWGQASYVVVARHFSKLSVKNKRPNGVPWTRVPAAPGFAGPNGRCHPAACCTLRIALQVQQRAHRPHEHLRGQGRSVPHEGDEGVRLGFRCR